MESLTDAGIAIVGQGRLGKALTFAMKGAELRVIGPLGRGADGDGAGIVILCVPDSAIADAARAVPPGKLVGHCSGASTLAPLQPHEAFSMHPLMTVAGNVSVSFAGAGCAIAGTSERARRVAIELARRLRLKPFELKDADRDLYHAAASLASNYLMTLEGAAERLAGIVGVERELLLPLVRTAVENWGRLGARQALTGPIVRGDLATSNRQHAAVALRAPDLLPLWDALTMATQALAQTE